MRRIITLLSFLCLFLTINAQETLWTGAAASTDWNDAANWSAGVPTTGMTATILGNAPTFPIYAGSPVVDITIQNFGTITFNSFVYNSGTIVNFTGNLVVSDGLFINAGAVEFDNDGTFEINGTFENYGRFEHSATAILNLNASANYFNYGYFKNNGIVNIDGVFTNLGTFRSTNDVQNNNSFINKGDVEIAAINFNNNNGATLDNQLGSTFSANGIFANAGSLTNDGTFDTQIACDFNNTGSVISNGDFNNAGILINNSTFTSNATFLNSESGTLDNQSIFTNNGTIENKVCGRIIQNANNTIAGPVNNNGLVFEIAGQVVVTNLEFGLVTNDINTTAGPVPGCQSGGTLFLDENGQATLPVSLVDKGGYASCGAVIATKTVSPNTFTTADLGAQLVTLTVTDNLGNSSSCDAVIFVIEYQAPIIPVDDPDIDFTCPNNITVTAASGATSAPVNWTEPTATSNCSPPPTNDCSTIPDPTNNTISCCNNAPTSITDYTYIGEHNGSKYFYSYHYHQWNAAISISQSLGGNIVVINDAAENSFLSNNLPNNTYWIGYTDEDSEGNFQWIDGSNSTYTSWLNGEPNNYDPDGYNADYAVFYPNDGKWRDRFGTNYYRLILEIPCDCPAPNWQALGEFDGSKYFVSSTAATWEEAHDIAQINGVQLVTINSMAENDFIQNAINPASGSVWLGLNTYNSPGSFQWVNGETVSFLNWQSGEPNGNGIDHAARMKKSTGEWTDRTNAEFEYVIEIPCGAHAPSCQASGTISREKWTGISGNFISQIPLNTTPNLTDELNIFEIPVDADDNYGTRVRGYIFPPTTGQYTFWISSDDNGELYLSTDDTEANKQLIANVPGWSSSRQWDKFPAQQSTTITLQAGQRYYIEALQKEGTGLDNLAVGWQLPDASFERPIDGTRLAPWDNGASCSGGTGDITVQLIGGPQNGDNFLLGTSEVSYQVTDDCGNEEICTFEVTVVETPAVITLTTCPSDLTFNTLPGAPSTQVSWNAPTGSTTCYRDGFEATLITGPESGDILEPGTQQVSYGVVDSCGTFEPCVFNVTVVATPAVLTMNNCPTDINLNNNGGGAIATWTAPTGSSDCYVSGINVTQIEGPTSGSVFPTGTTRVTYLITDNCSQSQICIFNVTVSGCPDDDNDGVCNADDLCPGFDDTQDGDGDGIPDGCDTCDGNLTGQTCDDADPCTENDVYDANCNCAGTATTDTDNDGICDTEDNCPNNANADQADIDNDGIGDVCDTCDGTLIGQTCDDGDPCTENDVYDANCNCAGTATADTDNDGICDAEDNCPNNANADQADIDNDGIGDVCDTCDGNLVGTTCDDGDPNTLNDVYDANCNCAGTPIGTGCTTTQNLALNKPATQSSIVFGAAASRANDGNTDGNFLNNSVSATDTELNPWWTVDLGAVYNIEDIEIWNRTDNRSDRLSDYYVFISDNAFTSTDINTTIADATVTNFYFSAEVGTPTTVAANTTGRYVRIQLNYEEYLTIAEIKVIGCSTMTCPAAGTACDDNNPNTENDIEDGNCNCAGTPITTGECTSTSNIALTGTATQSSTVFGAVAARANDGNINGDFLSGSVSATDFELNAWWEIDLGEIQNIETINVWNRTDNRSDRLSDYYVLISDTPFSSTDLTTSIAQTGVMNIYEISQAASPSAYTVGRTGRFVRIQLNYTENLTIAEVEIMGCSLSGCPAAGTSCDDGDATTINDVEDGNCNCAGTPIGNGTLTLTCPNDINLSVPSGTTSTPVSWAAPSISTTCPTGGETISQTDGPISGNDFPIGITTISYAATDDCGNNQTCSFTVTVSEIISGGGYCDVQAEFPWQEWVSNVSIGTINNDSDKSAYGDYTAMSTDLAIGSSNPLSVSTSFSYLTYSVYTRVWIDFNQDDIFDASEIVLTADQTNLPAGSTIDILTSDVTVPASAAIGTTRMRVMIQKDNAPTPCNNIPFGEVEDYSINIVATSAAQRAVLALEANKVNRTAQLAWATNTEFKNKYFVIERSTDNENFEKIGTINSQNELTEQLRTYQFVDDAPIFGQDFYRIKQVFIDGNFEYTNVKQLNFGERSQLNLYPNPAGEYTLLDLQQYKGKQVRLTIFNTLGMAMRTIELDEINASPIRINLSEFENGIYTIFIQAKGKRAVSKKLIVTRIY